MLVVIPNLAVTGQRTDLTATTQKRLPTSVHTTLKAKMLMVCAEDFSLIKLLIFC